METLTVSDRADSLLGSLGTVKVLVVGDLMLDRFVYGSVDRISPESPVPVLSISREDFMLGGAGNALANLAGLGVQAEILSLVGDDTSAEQICSEIENLGFSEGHLIRDESRPTTIKTRFLSGHQQLLRTDFEKSEAISDGAAQTIIERAEGLIKHSNAVILSDYGKGLLRDDVIRCVIEAASAAGVPVIVDPKGWDFSKYKGAHAITPNKKELSDALGGAAVNSDEEIEAAAKEILETCGIEAVIATRSAQGISVVERSGKASHIPTKDIEVFDVSGAGDSVIATIASVVAAGGTLEEAAMLANMAGSIVVAKVGTAPIRIEELVAALHDQESRLDLLSWEEMAEQVRRWQAKGLKVGFTNGCFDIVHYGHVAYLDQAHEHCDRLVVGLNSDASVRILKGKERPIHDQRARGGVLSGLAVVDGVVLFGAEKAGDDNTANALLELLKPDIYFKGGDYSKEQIPEAPIVEKNGGEVLVMPEFEGYSTTAAHNKSKGEAA